MNFSQYFERFLIDESYENVSNFLLDPANKDKFIWELEEEFEKDGGKIMGEGCYGKVYSHPRWNYVAKTFFYDACYLKFIRHATNNPSPAFPKIIGNVQRVVPQFKRHWAQEQLYIVRMEPLIPIYSGELDEIRHAIKEVYLDEDIWKSWPKYRSYTPNMPTDDAHIREVLKNDIKMQNYILAYNKLIQYNNTGDCVFDLHSGNIMIRPSTEQCVITDPFAHIEQDKHCSKMLLKKREASKAINRYRHQDSNPGDTISTSPVFIKGGDTVKRKNKIYSKDIPVNYPS